MPSIITITLNPAIDKSTSVPTLVPEKKLRCSTPVFEPGGGGVNVARAIKKLGGHASAIYFSGGYTGAFFTQMLRHEGIDPIVVETVRHTRENLIVLNQSTNLQYRFGMPGPHIEEKEWIQLLDVIEKIPDTSYIVASGSLPPGAPLDIFARIAVLAKKKNAKFIVDTSGPALQHAADEGVYLLKPNLAELCMLAGTEMLENTGIRDVARSIINKGQCEAVVVSMGAAGAILVTATQALQFTAPAVNRKSTVGAGDSMVAGIVLQLAKANTLIEAVQYGVACGTAATLNPGTELCRLADVDRLYPMIHINSL